MVGRSDRGVGEVVDAFLSNDASNHVGFHQDIDVLPPAGLTFWVPLQDMSAGVPGLELIRDPVESDHGLRVKPRFLLGAEEVDRNDALNDAELWRPAPKRGDALVFTPYVLHRTQARLGERRRVDVRFVPARLAGSYPACRVEIPGDSGGG